MTRINPFIVHASWLILLTGFGIIGSVHAQTCNGGLPVTGAVDITISADCSGLMLDDAGNVEVISAVSVKAESLAGFDYVPAVFNKISTNTLTNNGTLTTIDSLPIVINGGVINALTNNGLIATNAEYSVSLINVGSIETFTNTLRGEVSAASTGGYGIYNEGFFGSLKNSGRIQGWFAGVNNEGGVIGTLVNDINGAIVSFGGIGIANSTGSFIGTIDNSGTISASTNAECNSPFTCGTDARGIANERSLPGFSKATITQLTNRGSISATTLEWGNAYGVSNSEGSTIFSISNFNEIFATTASDYIPPLDFLPDALYGEKDAYGIYNGGRIDSLHNTGVVRATAARGLAYGIYNSASGSIGAITNNGAISASAIGTAVIGIANYGTLTTLNNSQGGTSSSAATTALAYDGNLPENYNIGINNPGAYGQLSVTNPSGAITHFGIYGTPLISSRIYASVLTNNVTVTNVQAKYDNMSLALVNNLITGAYDLTFTGVSLMGAQQSLANTANALLSVYAMQDAVLAGSFTYDCTLFGANNICISTGGRNTAVQAADGLNSTSGLLIASYRLDKSNSRIGAYADQNFSVNNSGSTVTLTNKTPLVGLFGVWSERPDGVGAEVKVSAAYGQKNITVTRQVIGLSEGGFGSSQLNSQGAQVVAKYGFGVTVDTVVSPYAGLRYTENNMPGYSEGASAIVTAPLMYSALNTSASVALAGVGARHLLNSQTTLMASAGIESDLKTPNGSYYGTNSSISGLTPVNFNANPVKTRTTASLGATYLVDKTQQIGLTGIYRQEVYQADSTTSVFLTYTIGL